MLPEASDVVGMHRHRRHHAAERIGQQQIVGIEEDHERRAAGIQTPVARSAHSGPAYRNQPDPRIGNRCHNRRCRIARAIIDHDHLEIGERLPQDAADCFAYVPFHIPGSRDDGDRRRRSSSHEPPNRDVLCCFLATRDCAHP
jgi:hypothetical protein